MLLVVEGVNGKDRSQLIRAGTLNQVGPRAAVCLSINRYYIQPVFKCVFQMQHTLLVMKQLVLLHGVPSDVKVSSVIDEAAQEELSDEIIAARRVSWKMDEEPALQPRAVDDASGSRATQVSQIKTQYLLQQQLFP